MQKRLLVFFIGVLLAGCTSAPRYQVPDGLWYAEKEDPTRYGYQVYVYFKNDKQFIWWRTKETQDVVMQRWAYYTHDHPGVDHPTAFTREGDSIKGERILINKNDQGVLQATTTQTFTGRFQGDTLEMALTTTAVWASGNDAGGNVVRWSMKRLKPQAAK